MAERVDVPGGWVAYRNPEKIPEKYRRKVMLAAQKMSGYRGDTESLPFDLLFEATDAAIVAMVSEWSFGSDVTLDALAELPGDAYDAIGKYCFPLIPKMVPDFGPSKETDSPT